MSFNGSGKIIAGAIGGAGLIASLLVGYGKLNSNVDYSAQRITLNDERIARLEVVVEEHRAWVSTLQERVAHLEYEVATLQEKKGVVSKGAVNQSSR